MPTYQTDSSGRRIFPLQLKTDVLALVEAGASIAEVCAEYDLDRRTILKWQRRARLKRTRDFPPDGSAAVLEGASSAHARELAELREQLRRSQMREVILKKALAIINPPD